MLTTQHVDSHRKQLEQLKIKFNEIQQTIADKFKEFENCIKSVEQLNQEAEVLVRNLEDSLANVSNDAKEWQQIKVKLATTTIKGKIKLDVGGEKYITSIDTLTREKNTFFTAMFSRQWELERDPNDDSIFIDRDGKLFADILAYLRTDFVPNETMTNESLRQKLIVEAKYFHLHGLIEILTQYDRFDQYLETFLTGGTLLSNEQRKTLFEFCDKMHKKSELLYKASRDGMDAHAFHNRCNNQGATITIIRSNNGYLFGGYTSVAWTSNGVYIADDKAFLFTLINPHNIPSTKYPIQPLKTQNATYHDSRYGPAFGAGHDFYIYSNRNSMGACINNFPNTYTDSTGKGNNTFAGINTITISDMEVFKLA